MQTDEALAQLVEHYGVLPRVPSDGEPLLHYLRDHACSKIDCMRALMHAYHVGLQEAKALVHLSQTWADVRARDDAFHDRLWEIIADVVADHPQEGWGDSTSAASERAGM